MKQHIVEVNDWTPYQKAGKTVAHARADIAQLKGGEEALKAASMVVAIYSGGKILQDDDVIPNNTEKKVARVMLESAYQTALERQYPKPAAQLQPIEEPKQEAALQEAPKKPTLAEIDLSEYIGETVAGARAAIAKLVDLKENHVVALLLKTSVLKDDAIVPEGVSVREMLETTYSNALNIGQNKPTEQPQQIEETKQDLAPPVAEQKKPSLREINLSDSIGKTVADARAAIAKLVEVPEGKIIVFYRKQNLILDTETLSDLSGVTASFMKIEQHTQLNAPKNVWKISDIDGTEIEIEGSTLEIALATYFGDDAKVNRYETKQGLIVGTDYSSTRFYIGDYDFYKYGNSLCYIPSNTKHADIQAALEEALSTEEKRVGVNKLEIGRKRFERVENPYVICKINDGTTTLYLELESFNIPSIKDELRTKHGYDHHHLIIADEADIRLHHNARISIRVFDNKQYSLFKQRDGSIKEISIVDKQDSPVSQLHNAFSRAFSHNGVGVPGIIQPREDNDYTNSGFYISNRIIRVEVSTDPIRYVFADANAFENNDAALKAAVGLITPLDKMVKFISRDEEVMFVHKQGKYDMNIIAAGLFGMESAIKLIGANGLNVTFNEPADHDYRAQTFFNPNTLIEIKRTKEATIYADAAKFDGKDDELKAALDQRLGGDINLDQFLKFRAADGNISFTQHQDGQDDLAIIARALNLDTATKLLGENGITAEARENHDYRDLYIAKQSIEIKLSNENTIYADAAKFDGKDAELKAALAQRLGGDINLDQFLKFRAADGNISFRPYQNGQDDLAIIASALNLDTHHTLLGENGITAEARKNHDYRDLYIAKQSSKIKLPDNTFVYVDREKLGSEDDIKAAFTERFEYKVNLEWDPNDPEVGIISKVPEVAPVPQPNTSLPILLGLASGASATLLTHLASTYFETEVHNAAKVIIGVVVGYAIYRHLEQQNTTEQSL